MITRHVFVNSDETAKSNDDHDPAHGDQAGCAGSKVCSGAGKQPKRTQYKWQELDCFVPMTEKNQFGQGHAEYAC
jgi:hypothetical protein